ncbi:MAG: hypothetical protein ACTSSP_03105 [Candidatus Asgardarchaeia archaeon]
MTQMKAYGKKRKDGGCCPGHDKYPSDRYNTTTPTQRKNAQKSRKTSARQIAQREIEREI